MRWRPFYKWGRWRYKPDWVWPTTRKYHEWQKNWLRATERVMKLQGARLRQGGGENGR